MSLGVPLVYIHVYKCMKSRHVPHHLSCLRSPTKKHYNFRNRRNEFALWSKPCISQQRIALFKQNFLFTRHLFSREDPNNERTNRQTVSSRLLSAIAVTASKTHANWVLFVKRKRVLLTNNHSFRVSQNIDFTILLASTTHRFWTKHVCDLMETCVFSYTIYVCFSFVLIGRLLF